MQTHYWYDAHPTLQFQFDNPFYVAPPLPDPVMRLVITEGGYSAFDYYYFGTNNGHYIYGMVSKGETDRYVDDRWDISFNPGDGIFHDLGSNNPTKWGFDNTGTNLSAFPTDPNMQTHYWYDDNGSLRYQFDNPYYVA